MIRMALDFSRVEPLLYSYSLPFPASTTLLTVTSSRVVLYPTRNSSPPAPSSFSPSPGPSCCNRAAAPGTFVHSVWLLPKPTEACLPRCTLFGALLCTDQFVKGCLYPQELFVIYGPHLLSVLYTSLQAKARKHNYRMNGKLSYVNGKPR